MKLLRNVGLPLLSMVLICLFPCAFMFFRNAGEARAADMLPFFGIFLLTAALVFLAALALVRNISRAAVIADLAALAVINFTMLCNAIKTRIPGFRNMILLVLFALILLGLLIWFLRRKPDMTPVCGILALMFGVMILVNGIPAVPTLLSAAEARRQAKAADPQVVEQTFTGEKRNFYYMIFDEYGGPENLLHYYDYDNADFWNGLRDRGFVLSETSKNTESAWTVTLLPNLVNIGYVTSDEVPPTDRMEWLLEPAIYTLFRNNGYSVQLVNQDNFLGTAGCRVLTSNQVWETISTYLYENSIFCQIPRLKWVIERQVLGRGPNSQLRSMENTREALISCWETALDGPTLTVCYVAAPHAPFLFRPDGSNTRPGEYYDWRRPELYLSKLEYINPAILEAVDNIQKNDPEAVIVLQSDHGSRLPGQMVYYFGGPWFDAPEEIPYMENVFNAVYAPGFSLEIEGENCINTVRRTLNTVYGTEIPPVVPPPDYEIPAEYMPPPEDREDSAHG